MSKLADAIRRSQRVEAAPLGFGAARLAAKPSLLVGYQGPAAGLKDAREAGADLLIAEAETLDAATVKKLREDAGDLVLGLKPARPGADTRALREAGADFLTFVPETTPAAALLDDDMGYVTLLGPDPEELLLRSLESLSLEAVFLAGVPSPLTVAQQITLVRIASFSRKPLICLAPPDASSEDLQCLRAAGVVALVVEGAPAGVARLKENVASMPPRRQRREERPVVALPRGAAPSEAGDNDDDDD
jgi:hypothetical protein